MQVFKSTLFYLLFIGFSQYAFFQTANAAALGNDVYAYQETTTNKIWKGKTVYRIMFDVNYATGWNSYHVGTGITIIGFDAKWHYDSGHHFEDEAYKGWADTTFSKEKINYTFRNQTAWDSATFIVEYTKDADPAFAELTDASDIYSYDETETHKIWNSKTVYRKIVDVSYATGWNSYVVDHDISIIGFDVKWRFDNGSHYETEAYKGWVDSMYGKENIAYTFRNQTTWDGATFIVEYTKDNDPLVTELSDYNEIYSYDETVTNKVWNGKTVYRKMFDVNYGTGWNHYTVGTDITIIGHDNKWLFDNGARYESESYWGFAHSTFDKEKVNYSFNNQTTWNGATIIAEYTKDNEPDFPVEPATIVKQTLDYAPDTQTISGSGELNQAGAITITLTDPDSGAVLYADNLITSASAPFSYSYSIPLTTVPPIVSASFIPQDNAGNQGEELIALIDTFFPSFTLIIPDQSGSGYQTTTFIKDESYASGGYYVEEPVSGTVVETNGDVVQISTGLSTDLEVTGGIVIDESGTGGNGDGSGGSSDDGGAGGNDDDGGQTGGSGDEEDPYANLGDLPGVPVAIVTAGTSGGLTTISFTLTSAFDQLLCLANGACVILEDLTRKLATTRTVLSDGRVRYSTQVMLVPDEIHLYSLRPVGTASSGGSDNGTGGDSGNSGSGDDSDGDGISDTLDNCPVISNSGQEDFDGDGVGDACDPDADGDLVDDSFDNCPLISNSSQADQDGDGLGNACDADVDGDLIDNSFDNCPVISNSDQADLDGDGIGDACDSDIDGDLIDNGLDNCPIISNSDQADLDGDNIGDICDQDVDGDLIDNGLDNCPINSNAAQADLDGDNIGDVCDLDIDGDMIANAIDNCPVNNNPDQSDLDGDNTGDACDLDIDGDLIDNGLDNCPIISNADQADLDGDNVGDACDLDIDGDLIDNSLDNCPIISNTDQADLDGDNIGDICDPDMDGDLIDNGLDNCPIISNTDQADLDGDGIGNACDSDIDGDGWSGIDDCNDFNALINPDAQEIANNGIDENCNGMADDTIEGQIDSIFDIIDQIPTTSLKNKNNAKTLKNKLNAIIELVNDGLAADTEQERTDLITEALDKLENDLIKKTDGCAIGGSPDKKDWVTDCVQQDKLYPALTQLQVWINTLF